MWRYSCHHEWDLGESLPTVCSWFSLIWEGGWRVQDSLGVSLLVTLRKKLELDLQEDDLIDLLAVQHAAAAAKSLQSCPTLCDPIDGSPPGSSVPGILQAWTLEWVAISFSIAWKWKVKVKSLSFDQLVATPWTAAHQAPPTMGFSRQEYWSDLPLPSPCCATWGAY